MTERHNQSVPNAPLLDALDQEIENLDGTGGDEDLPNASEVWHELDTLMTEGEPDPSAPLTVHEHRRLRAFESRLADPSVPSSALGSQRRVAHAADAYPTTRSSRLNQALAVAAALLIGVLAMGWWQAQARARWAEQHLLESTRTAALLGLDHQSAGARLQAVAMTQNPAPGLQSAPDEAVLEALLRAAREDPSDNVRLAAVEALTAWADRPEVAGGLIASVPRQRSPAVLWQLAASTLPYADPSQRERLRRLVAEHEDRLGPDITRELTSLIDEATPEI